MYIEQLIAHMQENKYLYLLESKVKLGWYLIDYAMKPTEDCSAAIWFPNQRLAVKFGTEEEVEEFSHNYMAPRPVSIVRVEVEEILRRL